MALVATTNSESENGLIILKSSPLVHRTCVLSKQHITMLSNHLVLR